MAADAVVDGGDVECSMNCMHLAAGMAGVAGILGIGLYMTDLAIQVPLGTQCNEKGVLLELGRSPGGGGVATFTLEAEFASVEIGLVMAVSAFVRVSDIDVVLMAIDTGDGRMAAR
jgi:hypothetical protein